MADIVEGSPTSRAAGDLVVLLHESARGSEQAFAAVYDATASRAYGLALRVLRDPTQAEKVTHEAYLHLWSHSTTFDPTRSSPVSWILTTVHRKAVRRLRSAGIDASASKDAPIGATHASTDAQAVHQALADLPAAQREALELTYFGAYSCAQLSAARGVSAHEAGVESATACSGCTA